MPVDVEWLNSEKTIILISHCGIWTLKEFHNAVDQSHDMAVSVSHTVHYVSDFTHSQLSPANLLSEGQHIKNKSTPNSGIVVLVEANPFLKALMVMTKRLFLTQIHIYHSHTIESAIEVIRQHEENPIHHR